MESQTYRTSIGCCTDVIDELIVEAFYVAPTIEGAAAVAALVNERGYNVTPQELLETMYE